MVFGRELQHELEKKHIDVALLDFESLQILYKGKKDNTFKNKFLKYKKIPKLNMFFRLVYIKKVIECFNVEMVNIHSSRWYYLLILHSLKKRNFIITFYGSDFYRTSNFIKNIQKPLYEKAKFLTFTNPQTKKSFLKYYKKYNEKSFVCRFGLRTLEYIDKNRDKEKFEVKEKLGYAQDKTIVTCGYNSTKEQQLISIIENIKKLPKRTLDKVQFIFPMTYGDNEYKKEVLDILKNCNFNYKVLEDFLVGDENAYIKLASDIMINVLKTDSFSGSMQEFIYAGNIIITGDWLPYELFEKKGIQFIKIDNLHKLHIVIEEEICKYKKNDLINNVKIIHELSSWEKNIDNWVNVLERKGR